MEGRLRDVYGSNSYQSEPELISDGEGSLPSELATLSQSLGICAIPEQCTYVTKWRWMGAPVETMRPSTCSRQQVVRGPIKTARRRCRAPRALSRILLDSDGDEPVARANTIDGVDDDAPQDAENPCKCSFVHSL